MAVDEALARRRPEGEGTLRIYRWSRPSLSLGRNQRARGAYDPMALRALGTDVVRRPTGGREVLHDRELTYTLVLPARSPGGLRGVYQMVNQALVEALRSLGVSAGTAVARGRTPSPDAGACFQLPVAGEVEVKGRKLAGSAQVRLGETLLQHGSLLLGPASVRLSALTGEGRLDEGKREQEGVTLTELVDGPVSFPAVAAAVEAAVAGALGGRWRRDRRRPEEAETAESLLEHYKSWDWTWRR